MKNTLESMSLQEYFVKWFTSAVTRMASKGVTIDITFLDFMTKVVTPRQYASLQKTMDAGWLNSRQATSNDRAYVITWKSYAARTSNVFNLETACFCTRAESEKRSKPAKGEALRPSHRANISKKLRGVPKTEEHAGAISEALTGRTLSLEHKQNLKKPKAPWTEERKAQRRAQIAARKPAGAA